MNRECDYCEQNEAVLKCPKCFKAYCSKCSEKDFVSLVSNNE